MTSARTLMNRHAKDFVDPITGEVNATELAEFVCDQVNGYDATGNIPEKFFDWAFVAAERYEIATGVLPASTASSLRNFINTLPSDYF